MVTNRKADGKALTLETLLQKLVDAGASIIVLEKDVPVVGEQPGFVLRVTPQAINADYPGLTRVEFEGRELVVECTIDNYGTPLGEDQGLVDLLPVYVSDDVHDPVSMKKGIENIQGYLGGDDP